MRLHSTPNHDLRLRASDLLLALLAGLGIAILGRRVLLSVQIQTTLPVGVWLFSFLTPVIAAAGILVAARLQRHLPALFEIAKFGLVGALSTTIDLALFNFLMETTGIFRGSLFPLLKGASFLVALLNAYLWNRNWTFRPRGEVWKQQSVRQFSLYAAAAIGGLALNVMVATLIVNLVPVPTGWYPVQVANVGAVAALGGSATWDFLCFKFIVFRPATQAEGMRVGHGESL